MNSSSSLCRRSSRPFSNRIPPQTRDRPVLASMTIEGSSRRSMTVPRATMAENGDAAPAAPKTTTTSASSAPSLTVVSWDIDGTILRAKGDVANKLHHRAFSHAWKEVSKRDRGKKGTRERESRSKRERWNSEPRPRPFFLSLNDSLLLSRTLSLHCRPSASTSTSARSRTRAARTR